MTGVGPAFPVTYSRMVARELQLDDAGLPALLEGTSLTPQDLFLLDRQVSFFEQYNIIRNGLRLSGNPAFGLQVGSRMPLAAHGSLGAAAASAATLGEAFAVISRFQGLRAQFVKLDYALQDGHYVIDMKLQVPLDEVGLFLLEAMVASSQWMVEFILGRPLTDAVIKLGYPAPAHAPQYPDYLHGAISFDQPATSLSVPCELLGTRNHFSDPLTHAQSVLQCEREEVALRPRETWSSRIIRLLQQHPGQLWTLPEVATALNVSVRTLIRHLGAEGSSYQQLLDEELRRQALLHFESARHTVASVAAAVGYQDVSAFRRAFKRWTGMTPQAWLQRSVTHRSNP